MTPDHEAAKKIAVALVDEKCAGVVDIAYLDAMARLDKAEKERDGWKDAYFELIRAIGSTPGNSKSPVSIAHELMARRDKATELLRALKARLDRYESVTGDDYAEVRAFLAAERK